MKKLIFFLCAKYHPKKTNSCFYFYFYYKKKISVCKRQRLLPLLRCVCKIPSAVCKSTTPIIFLFTYSVVGPCVTPLFSMEFHGHSRTSHGIPGNLWKVADVFPRSSEINGLYSTFIGLPRNFGNKLKFDCFVFFLCFLISCCQNIQVKEIRNGRKR